MPTQEAERGVGPAAKQVAEHASTLARLELELALLEVKGKVAALGSESVSRSGPHSSRSSRSASGLRRSRLRWPSSFRRGSHCSSSSLRWRSSRSRFYSWGSERSGRGRRPFPSRRFTRPS